MSDNKIVITTSSFGRYDKEPLDALKKKGFESIMNPCGRKLERKELMDLCLNAVGIIAGTEELDNNTLRRLIKLKVISRCGAGLENIDLSAAGRLGIKVFNTPDAPVQAVAELTVGLIINLLRKVNQMDADIRNGKWEKLMGSLLCGKRVGIVGFGRIGSRVSRLLSSFGCKLAYYDPFLKKTKLKARYMPLKKLLKWADIISIHASGRDKVLGKNEFNIIKKGAWLINASRGEIIDEKALYRALREDRLAGAALDVFGREPYNGPLKEFNNVILTPHIGSYAKEARIKMETEAVRNLVRGLRGVSKVK